MADDVALKDASDVTFTAATDEISGRHYPLAKLAFGGLGTATLASSADPFPTEMKNANANGQTTSANSAPVVIASDQSPVKTVNGAGEYESIGASATAQVLGTSGAIGDYVERLIITPLSTSPGNVILIDNAISITVFAGGTLTEVRPLVVDVGARSVSGAWKVTTGANVSVLAVGDFT